MTAAPELVLVGAVIAVGVLHTIVPDHWMPIALLARQRGWSRRETTSAALKAGTGHVVSTLLIGLVVWIAGVAFATRFGTIVSIVSSLALIGFGGWIAVGSWLEMRAGGDHAHAHGHAGAGHEHAHEDDHDHAHEDVHDHAHEDVHARDRGVSSRTALLLILGSSPMVEGIPAFFAAARYGPVLIAVMSLAFAAATIFTYVVLCVGSTAGLERVRLGAFERYGEVISGAFIALVGVVFLIVPIG